MTRYKTYRYNAQRLDWFQKYMLTNYKSWQDLAEDQGHGISLEDIVFVTGCDMTEDFAMLAFRDNARETSLSFELGAQNAAAAKMAVWGVWSCQGTVFQNWGPQDDIMPPFVQDEMKEKRSTTSKTEPQYKQCVFLRGYRVYRRWKIIPKVIKAHAGPHDLSFGDRDTPSGSNVPASDGWGDDDYELVPQLNMPEVC